MPPSPPASQGYLATPPPPSKPMRKAKVVTFSLHEAVHRHSPRVQYILLHIKIGIYKEMLSKEYDAEHNWGTIVDKQLHNAKELYPSEDHNVVIEDGIFAEEYRLELWNQLSEDTLNQLRKDGRELGLKDYTASSISDAALTAVDNRHITFQNNIYRLEQELGQESADRSPYERKALAKKLEREKEKDKVNDTMYRLLNSGLQTWKMPQAEHDEALKEVITYEEGQAEEALQEKRELVTEQVEEEVQSRAHERAAEEHQIRHTAEKFAEQVSTMAKPYNKERLERQIRDWTRELKNVEKDL